jgi:hypothetical protein
MAEERRRLNVGDPIPYVLTKADLCELLQLSVGRLDVVRQRRSHPAIKELECPGHVRFCGRTVKAWLDGDTAIAEGRRFFQGARRR